MKRLHYKLLIAIALCFCGGRIVAQNIVTMVSGTTVTVDACQNPDGLIYDDGGNSGSYSNYFDGYVTITAQPGMSILLWGNYETENCCDRIRVYDGNDVTTAPQLGEFRGQGTLSVSATSGYMTIYFHTDLSVTHSGFELSYTTSGIGTNCTNLPTIPTVDNVTANSARVSWNASSAAGPFMVALDGGTPFVVNGTSHTFNGLAPGHVYEVALSSVADSLSPCCRQTRKFRTTCRQLTHNDLPYHYGFEDATGTDASATIDSCWTRLSSSPYATLYPSTFDANSGVYSLNMVLPSSRDNAFLILPEYIDTLSVTQLRLSLRSRTVGGSGKVDVGVMTDLFDTNTFVKVGSVRNGDTEFETMAVTFDSYWGSGRYVAMRVRGSANDLLIDDVVLERLPECSILNQLLVENVGVTSLAVSWRMAIQGASATEGYEVVATPVGGGAPVSVTVQRSPAIVTGLSPMTQYRVRVRPICTGNVYGEWDSLTVQTLCTGYRLSSVSGSSGSTATGVPVYSGYGNTVSQSIYTASELRAMGVLPGVINSIQYNWTANNTYAKQLEVYLGTTSQNSYSSNTFLTAGMTHVYSGYHPIGTSGVNTYTFTTPFYWDGVSNLVVTTMVNQPAGVSQAYSNFYGYNTNCGYTRTLYRYRDYSPYTVSELGSLTNIYSSSYRPDIALSACDPTLVQCFGPMIVVDSVGYSDITVSWAPGGTETEWEVAYRQSSATSWTVVATHYTGTTYHFTGLSRSTEYEIRITAPCGSSTAQSIVAVMTRCRYTTFAYDDLYGDHVVCRTGTYSNPDQVVGVVDFGNGSNLSRHTVHNDRTETDSYTGNQLYTVPEGYCTSVRLGNSNTGSEAESITYTLDVDTADYDMLLLKYASVLEDPNHTPIEQPRFTFLITDVNGDTISPCYNADFIANANLGWNRGSRNDILWKDWTTVGVDLSPMHGQSIRIKLTSYDCDQGGHFGYAYFVIDLDNKALRSNSCSSEENTFYAPSGFSYSWYSGSDPNTILSQTDSLHVTSEGVYYCDLSFVGAPDDDAHRNCFFTMMAHSGVRYPFARFTPVLIDTASCRFSWVRMVNQSIVTHDSAHVDSMANGCESYLWLFDDGTTSGDVNPRHAFTPGIHTVTLFAMLADGQCADSVSHTFLIESPCMVTDTVYVAMCEGEEYHVFDTVLADQGEYLVDSIGASDSLFLRTVFVTVNPRWVDTVVQAACGTYLWPQSGERYAESGLYDDTLANVLGCDSIVTLSLTLYPVYDSDVYDTVCQTALNAGYPWGNTVIHAADMVDGIYTDSLHTASPLQCDSVVTLHLEVLPVVFGDTVAAACDSFAWYGRVYGSPVTDTLTGRYTSALGCDSSVVLHLDVGQSSVASVYDTCSENQLPRQYGPVTAYCDTVATLTLTNAAGCDSVVTYHLAVLGNSHAVFDTTVCANRLPMQWYHRLFTGPGTQIDTIENHIGADSILTLTLHVSPVSADTSYAATCAGQGYLFEGTTYYDSGTYTHTLQNQYGCDSLRTLQLRVNPATHGDTVATACDTFSWAGHTMVQSDTVTVAAYTVNHMGCDSSVTLHLTLNHSSSKDSVAEACDSYTWFGQTFTASPATPPAYTLANAAGCDSIVRLVSLVIHHSATYDEYDTLCPAQLATGYAWHDTLLGANTTTGSYSLHRSTADGCDSTLTLHLTVYGNSTSTVYDTIVENLAPTWQYHGIAVSHDTTNMPVTLTNSHGCDSLVSYNLYIWRNVAYTYDSSICANQTASFDWHGQPYADTLRRQLTTTHGADSLVTLITHLLPVYTLDVYDTLCRDLLDSGYRWGDTILHYDGSDTAGYTRRLVSAMQCDSIVTLHLVVNPVYNMPFYDTVYYGDTVTFEGMVCTQPGVYVNRHVTAAGCDSLHTLYLYGRHMVELSRTDTLCHGDTLFFGRHVITQPGTYVDTMVSGNFAVADTLLTLTVVVMPYPAIGFDTAVVCGSHPHHLLTVETEATYLHWTSSPYDPTLEGQENNPTIRVSPTVATLYTVEADYRMRPLCRATDTLRIAPVDNVTAAIECRPPHITLNDRQLTAYDRSSGRVQARRWYVFYNDNSPFAIDEFPLRLNVPHTVDSLAIALAVAGVHCADTDTVQIGILRSGIFFPNVFTPSAATNNLFRCTTTGIHNFELWVYDRRGALVFHTTDIDEGWDGTHNGQPCRQEAYVYRCRYSNEEVPDGYQTYTGTVSLIR